MVKIHGFEKILQATESLKEVYGKPYAPQITTPLQLETKLGDLLAYFKRETTNPKGKRIII